MVKHLFVKLLIIFTVVPMVELLLLIELGKYIGPLPTLALVALTGVIGVSLARNQGTAVIKRIRELLSSGTLPTDSLIDGLLILSGGIMLLTPGLITDTMGFLLIIPASRKTFRILVKRWFKGYINDLTYRYSNYRQEDNDYR